MRRQFDLGSAPPAVLWRLGSVHRAMLRRCYDPADSSFADYGGRGIGVCDEWRGDPLAFVGWAVANGWWPGLHLDRVNNERGYCPGNCRFVTPAQNNLNKRSTVRLSNGRPALPAAKAAGLSASAFYSRLSRGWTPDEAAGRVARLSGPPLSCRAIMLARRGPAVIPPKRKAKR